MRTIGVIGRKGGSGKTTVAVHLAAEFATRGRDLFADGGRTVVLVDADQQGSATYWAEPGNLPMQVVHLPLEAPTELRKWRQAVADIAAGLLVLDAPPHLNAALGGVIGLSDLVVVPCGPSGLDLLATAETVGLVRQVRDERGKGRPDILLVPNRVDRRTASGRDLTDALKDIGEPVAPPIGYRTAFADAFNEGQWVGQYAKNSVAHEEMRALAERVLKMLRKQGSA